MPLPISCLTYSRYIHCQEIPSPTVITSVLGVEATNQQMPHKKR